LGYQYWSWRLSQTALPSPANDFPFLVLVPGTWIWYPWTLVTSSLVEINIIQLVLSLIFVIPSLRYLERLWGTFETVKFCLIVCTVSNILSLIVNYAESFVLGMPELFLYGMTYSGQMALQAALLVAFTQLIPEHQVQLFGMLKMRVKQIPMLYVGFSNVMCVVGFQSPYILIQWGWLVAWFYLRFYKKTTIEGALITETWGDRSETFAFVNWFPPFVHAPLGKVCEIVYNTAVQVKLVKPYPSTDNDAGYGPIGGGNSRAEAERRRAMALKALDQRMANAAKASKPAGSGAAGEQSNSNVGASDGPHSQPTNSAPGPADAE